MVLLKRNCSTNSYTRKNQVKDKKANSRSYSTFALKRLQQLIFKFSKKIRLSRRLRSSSAMLNKSKEITNRFKQMQISLNWRANKSNRRQRKLGVRMYDPVNKYKTKDNNWHRKYRHSKMPKNDLL